VDFNAHQPRPKLTDDPRKSPAQIRPTAAFSSASAVLTWLKMVNFGSMPTLMTLVNIGERTMGQIWGFWGVEFEDLARYGWKIEWKEYPQ